MTGSARQPSASSTTPRAPYAAPQSVTFSVASGVASATLSPFVPPGFRGQGDHSATSRPNSTPATVDGGVIWTEPVVGRDDAANRSDHEAASASVELPWIETFTVDASDEIDTAPANHVALSSVDALGSEAVVASEIEPNSQATPDVVAAGEDTWMSDEAGKRLNELTQSLSSLDALRADQTTNDASAAPAPTVGATAPVALPAWDEDEWMDIMPTAAAPVETTSVESVESEVAATYLHEENRRALEAAGAEALEMQVRHGESAAQALESVARRIRAGDFVFPDFEPELGDAAVLAAILASMLRTGR